MAEKKYKVADGSAVIVKGVVLKAGEAIPSGAIGEDSLKKLVAAKKIVEDKGETAKADEKKPDEKKAGAKKAAENGGGEQK